MKTVKEFQLEEQEKFLIKFLSLFQQIDSDQNGIISTDEFSLLYSKMSSKIAKPDDSIDKDKGFTKDVKNFLQILDPFNSDKINLSDVIKLFSD